MPWLVPLRTVSCISAWLLPLRDVPVVRRGFRVTNAVQMSSSENIEDPTVNTPAAEEAVATDLELNSEEFI